MDEDLNVEWYRQTYPDVDLSGLDPVQHYERIGRLLGRSGTPERHASTLEAVDDPLVSFVRAVVQQIPTTAATPPAPAPATPTPATEGPRTFPIIRAPGDLVEDVRDRLAIEPRTGGPSQSVIRAGETDVARFDTIETAQRCRSPLALYARLVRRDIGALVRIDSGVAGPVVRFDDGFVAPRQGLDGATLRLVDVWYTSHYGICLSLDRSAQTAGRDEGLVVRLFQSDPLQGRALRLIGRQRLSRQGPWFVDATLCHPFFPLLIEIAAADGATLDMAVLAFPSLARGGAHHAELVALIDGGTPTETLIRYGDERLARLLGSTPQSIAAIRVATDRAIGAEPIFSPATGAWLALFGPSLSWTRGRDRLPAPDDALQALGRDPDRSLSPSGLSDGASLDLPHDSLPTIFALTEPDLEVPVAHAAVLVPYLVAERVNYRPKYAVTLPPDMADLDGLQLPASLGSHPLLRGPAGVAPDPVAAVGGSAPARDPIALAIVYRDLQPTNEILRLMPVAPDSAEPLLVNAPTPASGRTVVAVIDVSDAGLGRKAIERLAGQATTATLHLALQVRTDAIADALRAPVARAFGERGQVRVGAASIGALLRDQAGHDRDVFLLDEATVLFDPRTLETLRSIIATQATATAAAVTIREIMQRKDTVTVVETGGAFPMQVNLLAGPRLVFGTPDTLIVFPGATYPVAANGPQALLIRADALAALAAGGSFERPWNDIGFGLDAIAAGYRNLCTSTVRVGTLRATPAKETMDPVAPRRYAPQRWDDLLARLTLLQDLR